MRTWDLEHHLNSHSPSLTRLLCCHCCGANNLRNLPRSFRLPQQTASTTASPGQARHRSAMTMNVDEEIERLRTEIERLGAKQPDGSIVVKFGTLFNDERCANIFEALVGTLRAAKKRKIVKFDSEMLFQGVHDNVDVVLLPKIVEPVAQPAVEAAP